MSITSDAIKHLRDKGHKVNDRRSKSLGTNNHNRSLSGLKKGGFHWDAVSGGTIEGHERYWRNHHGWTSVGGYTVFIDDAGTLHVNYDFEKRTNGVGNHNTPTLSICYAGTYSNPINNKQKQAAKDFWTFVVNDKRTNINSFNDIWGHNEFPGHSSNACPGVDMNAFRNYLKDGKVKPTSNPEPKPKKSNEEVAKEVFNGEWGNNPKRRNDLIAAGYNYNTIQNIVNRLAGGSKPKPATKSIDQLAREVMDGKHGTGESRKKALGNQYNAVQKRVNEILGAKTKSTPKPPKSIETLAREVIDGKHGTGDARKRSLGSQYQAVQKRVNQILGAGGSNRKSIDTIAREVIDGKWGNNPERSRKLRSAGYDANAVQRRVNQLI